MSDFREEVARRDDAVDTATRAAAANRDRIQKAVADFLTAMQRLGGKGARTVPIIEMRRRPGGAEGGLWNRRTRTQNHYTSVEVGHLTGWALASAQVSPGTYPFNPNTAVVDDGRLLTVERDDPGVYGASTYTWDNVPSLSADEVKRYIWDVRKLGTADADLVMACLVETYRICRGS